MQTSLGLPLTLQLGLGRVQQGRLLLSGGEELGDPGCNSIASINLNDLVNPPLGHAGAGLNQ